MVHFAGYAPRFHPSDFRTFTDDGVGADWPIEYRDLKPYYDSWRRSCPWRARAGPGGTRTATRTRPIRWVATGRPSNVPPGGRVSRRGSARSPL